MLPRTAHRQRPKGFYAIGVTEDRFSRFFDATDGNPLYRTAVLGVSKITGLEMYLRSLYHPFRVLSFTFSHLLFADVRGA